MVKRERIGKNEVTSIDVQTKITESDSHPIKLANQKFKITLKIIGKKKRQRHDLKDRC